jgi:hypothetical protein
MQPQELVKSFFQIFSFFSETGEYVVCNCGKITLIA